MRCPFCSHNEFKVVDKRDGDNSIRRRRECLKCEKRFTTYEKIEPPEIFVIKKNGGRENYDREKLKAGLMKACEKRPVSLEQIESAVTEIETKLAEEGKEVSTKMIGEQVMKKLRKLDKVAYVRFASVYKEFKDVEEFKEEIDGLLKK